MNVNFSIVCKAHRLGASLTVLLAVCSMSYAQDSTNANVLTFLEIGEGKLFTQTGEGRFSAIDPGTGSILWSFHDADLGYFTRAVVSSGALFVAATSSSKTSSELIRLDVATGRINWRELFDGLGGNASPVVCGSDVLVGDYWHRTVSAFNIVTGKSDWKTESQPFLFLFPPAVLDGDALFLAANKEEPESKQQLVTVSCGGGILGKSVSVRIGGASRTPVLLYRDTVVISGYEKARGTSLKSLRRTDGVQLWSALIPDELTRFTPSIQGNFLIAGALSLWIVDLDTGSVILHEPRTTGSGPVGVKNGLVFSLSRENRTVEARELPSGKLRWSTKLKGKISSNIVATDSRVFVKVGDDQLAVLTMGGEIEKYLQIARQEEVSGAPY